MRRFYSLTFASVLLLLSSQAMAQENIHVRVSDYDTMWDFPFITDEISHFDISPSDNQLNAYSTNGIVIPFDADKVRQVTFEDAPAEETKDHYKVFQMYISTEDGAEIVSRDDYLPCYISLNAQGSFSNYSASAQIRGRGNSSWLWYDKKPYRIKLTDLMNTFVFELGQWLGLPYTNHTRYVEVFINGTHSRSKDYHILGRIYSNMGSISHLAGEYQLAYDMYSRSADLFLKDGDTVSYYYLLNDMAVELAVQGKKEETLAILNQIESNNATPSVLLNVLETKAELYLQVQQYDSAIYYSKKLSQYQKDRPTNHLICAQAYSYIGQKDSAIFYAKKVVSQSNSIYTLGNAYYMLTNDNTISGIEEIKEVAADRADILLEVSHQRSKLSQATQLLEQDLTRKPDMRGWMIVFIILISCVVIFIIIRKQRLHRQSIQHKVDIMEDKQVDNITKTIERYIDTNNIEKSLRWKNYVNLKSDADLYMGGIVSTLETYHLNETEIRYCVLFMLDFTPRRIAVMLHYNYPSGIKTLKKRICDKIVTQPQFLKETLLKIQPKM